MDVQHSNVKQDPWIGAMINVTFLRTNRKWIYISFTTSNPPILDQL